MNLPWLDFRNSNTKHMERDLTEVSLIVEDEKHAGIEEMRFKKDITIK